MYVYTAGLGASRWLGRYEIKEISEMLGYRREASERRREGGKRGREEGREGRRKGGK